MLDVSGPDCVSYLEVIRICDEVSGRKFEVQ
jgi:hypothetical protein